MKYKIEKVGEPGDLHIEQEDILSAQPVHDDLHAVELTLRDRPQYNFEEGYSARGSRIVVFLVKRQVQALIQQDRAGQEGFCKPCYDWGNRDNPGDCLRCQVIEAVRKAGKGDMRRSRPGRPGEASGGMALALLVMVCLFWWALWQWGATETRLEAMQRQERTAKR